MGFFRAEEFQHNGEQNNSIPQRVLQHFQSPESGFAAERSELVEFWKDPNVTAWSSRSVGFEISLLSDRKR
jgi:hypothetical protein